MPPDPSSDAPEPSGTSVSADLTDFRGSRRLVGTEEWFWYLLAAVTYITLGIWHKWLLNWFVGPAWLVGIVVVGPWITDRIGLTGRRDRGRAP
ncbi:hypothetical protein [Ilumatobacter nonamiensis]|uniref:hypothetical protein n=1 Tax=Ilumatobacter nonamiensis TaxID=467093 RepID=UPI000346DE6B|nr:hypothetical protein [Ilumatobacter nonamiensis]